MLNEPFFSEYLTDRQVEVINHFIDIMGFELNEFNYLKSEEFMTDLYPVDVAIFAPTKDFNYYTLTTSGLSQYNLYKNFTRVELCMVLPPEWKPTLDRKENMWAPDLLLDIAYQVVENKMGVRLGQYFVMNTPNGQLPYPEGTDALGGIICLPEMFPLQILEKEIEHSYTRFLQVVPFDKNGLSKIESMGPADYILYDLHDSDNPKMVAPMKKFEPKGIDKIIRKNEDTLKAK